MRVRLVTLLVLLSFVVLCGCTSNDGDEMAGPVSVEIDADPSLDDGEEAWESESPDDEDEDERHDGDDDWSDEDDDEDVDYEGDSDDEKDDVDFD